MTFADTGAKSTLIPGNPERCSRVWVAVMAVGYNNESDKLSCIWAEAVAPQPLVSIYFPHTRKQHWHGYTFGANIMNFSG